MWWQGDEVTFKRLWQGRPSDPLAWWVHDMIKCHFRKAQSRISASWSTSFPFIRLYFCRLHFRFFFFSFLFSRLRVQSSKKKGGSKSFQWPLSSGEIIFSSSCWETQLPSIVPQIRSIFFSQSKPTGRTSRDMSCWGFKSILQSLRHSSLQK